MDRKVLDTWHGGFKLAAVLEAIAMKLPLAYYFPAQVTSVRKHITDLTVIIIKRTKGQPGRLCWSLAE